MRKTLKGSGKRNRNNNTLKRNNNKPKRRSEPPFDGAGLVVLDNIEDEVKVLLVRGIADKWGFPKGKREPEETNSSVTAIRETEEETGLTRDQYVLHEPRFTVLSLALRYATIKPEFRKAPHVVRPLEIAEVRWFSFDEIRKLESKNLPLRAYLSSLESHPWWMKTIERLSTNVN